MEQTSKWRDYNQSGAEQSARPRVIETLNSIAQPGRALDLGAGGGRDTRELLKRGWTVDAVDHDPTAIGLLNTMAGASDGRVKVIPLKFEDLKLEPKTYDLVTGSYSLPFCSPADFTRFFTQLKNSLKPGGLLSVELFGIRDTWNAPGKNMTFLSRSEVDHLIRDMETVVFREEEYDGGTFSGEQKHWHLFTLIMKAR